MRVIDKSITELVPYAANPRKNKAAVPFVANSIKEFGFKVPIVIDSHNVIVAGHTRYQAAKSLGLTSVPCIVADDLTPQQIKAFRLADNKVSEKSQWDDALLADELAGISDIDMSEFDFELPALDIEDEEDGYYGDERERTYDAYNLTDFEPERAAGFYQMPIIEKCRSCPTDLIGFNYMLTTEPRKGLGVHFYVDDYQFERVWNDPEMYCEKLAAFDYVLTPDFSLYTDMPMAMKIWNIYRSRLIGQICQDLGARVIPTLSWAEEATFQFCFDGIEPGGVVSVSTIGVKRDEEATKIWTRGMDEAIKRLRPSCVLVYGGDIGYKFPCKVMYFNNRVTDKWEGRKNDANYITVVDKINEIKQKLEPAK